MNPMRWQVATVSAILLASLSTGWSQAWLKSPGIGYVYPAGGQAGTTVEVLVGGQFLGDATAYISGEGVEAEVTAVLGRPRNKIVNKCRELRRKITKQLREEAKDGNRPAPGEGQRRFLAAAKAEGITEIQLEEVRIYAQRRRDKKAQLNPQLEEMARLRMTLAKDAEPGMRELRLRTRNGLSNPIRFCVGSLPERTETEPNDEREPTEVASLPAMLNGQVMPGDVDRFTFRAKKGQHLVIDVRARALTPYLADAVPGWFQPVVSLHDAEGRELAYADDHRFDPDPVMAYRIDADGAYTLTIRDAIWRGREDFVYRIAIGELPFISSIFPLGGRVGQSAAVEVTGVNLPKDQRRIGLAPTQEGVLAVRAHSGPLASNAMAFAADDLPEVLETERGDEAPTKIDLPRIVNGRIDAEGDRDVYRFRGKKGQAIVAEVRARRLGSPLDSMLTLTGPDGKVLATNDDHVDKGEGLVTHHADSLLTATLPDDGLYSLSIADTQDKGGTAYAYRLRVGEPRGDFALRVVPSAINARASQSTVVKVFALRRDGFDGPIDLTLADAPEGFELSGATIPAGADQLRLTLTLPPKVKPDAPPIRLAMRGSATIGDREVVRQAVAADDQMQAFIYRHLVPAEAWLIVPARGRRAPIWTLDAPTPIKLSPKGTTTFRIRTDRWNPKNGLHLVLDDPPEGVALKGVKQTKDGFDVTLAVQAGKVPKGLRTNLIFEAYNEFTVRGGPAKGKTRRTSIGHVPAIPVVLAEGT
jgi:hypothetical protein